LRSLSLGKALALKIAVSSARTSTKNMYKSSLNNSVRVLSKNALVKLTSSEFLRLARIFEGLIRKENPCTDKKMLIVLNYLFTKFFIIHSLLFIIVCIHKSIVVPFQITYIDYSHP
jgi:hypothetical protein